MISYLSPKELELVYNALTVSCLIEAEILTCLVNSFLQGGKTYFSWVSQLAFEAHNGQKRRSGEPFIIHPVEVARILGELVSFADFE